MADNDATDMLMAVTASGTALAGEGQTALDPSDSEMLAGVTKGHFCEIQDINFGIGVEDSESAGGGPPLNEIHNMQQDMDTLQQQLAAMSGKDGKPGGGRGKSKQFKNFVDYGEVTDSDGKAVYSTVFDPITISRQIDIMSIGLLDACAKQTPMDKIVVVKRKFTGSTTAYASFVRFEFDNCLITAVDWDHGEVITEKLKFVYRSLTVKYRQQNPDGTLETPKNMNYSLAVASDG